VVTHVVPVENPEDAMIVTSVPERAGELREGTLLRTKMISTLSTESTVTGSRFTAEVTEPIERNGRVIIPVGSILEGRVTEVHGGKRITGGALLHLETSNVTLPDGTHYIVHAQVIDTGKSEFKVTDEGTLKKKDHALVVPRSAVLPDDDKQVLFTVKDGKAVRHEIKTGLVTDELVEVIGDNLHAGDSVVTLGNYELEDGMEIQAAEKEEKADEKKTEEKAKDEAKPATEAKK